MNAKLRRQLTQIDKWMLDPQTGRDLAAILAAVRGPDLNQSRSLKVRTTSYVRQTAFPRAFVGAAGWTNQLGVRSNDDIQGFDHFTRHVRSALSALGLLKPHNPLNGPEWKEVK